MDNRLTYDAEKHEYRYDGKVVPSVTQIVAPLGADYDEPTDMDEGVLDAATERGTVMHGYIAHRLTGGAPEDYEMQDAYAPYADAVDLFLAEHEIVPYRIEEPLGYDKLAGTPDLICEFDGKLAILDWKFVSTVSKSKVGAQLAGYLFLSEMNDVFPEALYAVQFMRDGTYRLYPVGMRESGTVFMFCLTVHDFADKKHPRGRIFEEDTEPYVSVIKKLKEGQEVLE